MSVKVLVDPDTMMLLGAQVVGGDGTDKRLDVLSVAMQTGLRADLLADLELAYAPMYGSAKDPVNQLGYVIENRLVAGIPAVAWHDVPATGTDEVTVLDVRTADEYRAGSIPGAVNIPVDDLRARHGELAAARPVIVVCEVGQRAHTATSLLHGLGFDARILDGGMRTWRAGHRIPTPAV